MANNNNGNNGNNSNVELEIPTETPTDIVIPKNKVARIKKYFGLVRNLANNNTNTSDMRLSRSLFEGLTDEQFRLFAMLITMELESTENHDDLYSYLNKVFRILEETEKTPEELLAINDVFGDFTFQSDAIIHEHDEDSEEPFVALFERLMEHTDNPRMMLKSHTFYLLNDYYRSGYGPRAIHLKRSLQPIASQIKSIGFDRIKPVADYLLLGDIQQGGSRKRKTRKIRKH